MLSKTDYVYFIYSKEEMELMKNIAKKRGKNLTLGTVIVNGLPKTYTNIVLNPSDSRFTDAIIVTSGILGDIKYNSKR